MLSGGDLDGDRYWVFWEPSLVQPLYERWKKGLACPPASTHEPPVGGPTEGPLGPQSRAQAIKTEARDDAVYSSSSESEATSQATELPETAAVPHATGEEEIGAVTALEEVTTNTTTPPTAIGDMEDTTDGEEDERNEEQGDLRIEKIDDEGTDQWELEGLAGFLLRVQGRCQLGVIANTHIRICHSPVAYYEGDPLKAKALDRLSLELADLAAAAVDAPKTGKTILIRQQLKCLLVPHFLARHDRRHAEFAALQAETTTSKIFASRSVLGSLFDRVLPVALPPPALLLSSQAPPPCRCLYTERSPSIGSRGFRVQGLGRTGCWACPVVAASAASAAGSSTAIAAVSPSSVAQGGRIRVSSLQCALR